MLPLIVKYHANCSLAHFRALGIFLPLGVSIYLSRISLVFLVGAIVLMGFLIIRMRGLARIEP